MTAMTNRMSEAKSKAQAEAESEVGSEPESECGTKSESEVEEVELLIKFVANKEKTMVLFAEADSYFTDILLSFLLLPLGTILKLLKKHYGEKMPVIGSLTTLYNGVANLDGIHFQTEDARSLLLNPTSCYEDEWPYIGEAYMDSAASFIISDDLRVMPNVESSIINTLSNLGFAITDMVGAKTYNMNCGYNEIMALLRVSLISRNPLTALLFCGSTMNITAGQENALKNQIGKKANFLNSKKMILKVMLQKSTNKLLFAQAQHDFISFLFGLLTIPLGRVGWYLHSNTGLRTVDNLHRSTLDNLSNNHLRNPEVKGLLFKPDLPTSDYYDNEYVPLNFDPGMSQDLVRGSRTYMVRDDLTVAPLGITSGLSVIDELKISLYDVEEVELRVGFQEGLSIMKAALTSTTALTDGLIKPMLKKQPNQEN